MITIPAAGTAAAATFVAAVFADAAPAGPTGTGALFGVVQTTLTIGSVVPLLLAVVALVLWVRARLRSSGSPRGSGRDSSTRDDTDSDSDSDGGRQRRHELARVSLLGSTFALVLLGIGEVVVGYGRPGGVLGAFGDGISPLVPVAAALTVVSAVAFAFSPSPRR